MMIMETEHIILKGIQEADQIKLSGLLGHKGHPWMMHLRDFFNRSKIGVLEGLEGRFYCVRQDQDYLSNICIWESEGHGILAHVYTVPAARSRGLSKGLMQFCLADFDARGGRWLQLNVEPNTFQQAFYERSGFQKVPGLSGSMVRTLAATYSIPKVKGKSEELLVKPFAWGDFPRWNRFFLEFAQKPLLHKGFGVMLPCSLEYPLIQEWFSGNWIRGISLVNGKGETAAIGTLLKREGQNWMDIIPSPGVAEADLQVLVDELLKGFQRSVAWKATNDLGVLAAKNGFLFQEKLDAWVLA